MKRIGIIGMGRMGKCLVRGWLDAKSVSAKNISFSTRRVETGEEIASELGLRRLASNLEVVRESDTVFFCVKPQNMAAVLDEVASELTDNHTLISIVASISTKDIERHGKRLRVVRAMPNTPALVRQGITAIAPGKFAEESDLEAADELFRSLGELVRVEESQMDAVTGMSGCGPAYVYLMLEAMTDAGIKVGLSRELALKLAAQTFLGSAAMVLQTGIHPAALRDEVTTPSGCTIEGLLALEEGKARVALIKAVVRATSRSRELREDKKQEK